MKSLKFVAWLKKANALPMKELLKKILALLHISLTRNQRYDAYTKVILKRVLKTGSVCIDVGCHKGEILDLMLKLSPDGLKFGFEPIPELYQFLLEKYSHLKNVKISPVALYNESGQTTFQHVRNAPAYSGIRKRKYSTRDVQIEQITVSTGKLDDLIPPNTNIDLIKIDVEGAEFKVLQGALKTLERCKPLIIFEFGLGAADFYGSTPTEVYFYLKKTGLKISTLHGFLHHSHPLSEDQFRQFYELGTEYYFIAHP
jgi:FkbM family methyltransferase